ncbi:MAG TPA: AAA family ATPase, partial [Candidatus Saccharimonadales bacterium]|nr:AAA family ATPase [Candidatus Saccharimonadales bacterium]
MFDDILLHETTKQRLATFINRPAHALLISGPAGAGKKYLAKRLAAVLLQIESDKLHNHPHFFVVARPVDKTEIPIDSARQLINKLSLKVPGGGELINRVAVIEDADLLSGEAQNALLKLLEEPPAGSLLILTTSRPQSIFPTVASRLQKLMLKPASLQSSQAYFQNFRPAEVESAWRLSRGTPSLLAALLAEGNDHQIKQAVEEAKTFLSLPKYERLGFLQSTAKDKLRLALLLDALSRILNVLHQANISNPPTAKKILEARKLVYSASASI